MHYRRQALSLTVLACLALSACGADEGNESGTTSGGSGGSGGAGSGPLRPRDPAGNDSMFPVAGAPLYLLAGDGLTPATESFRLQVTPPAGVDAIDLWLDDGAAMPLAKNGATLTVTVDAAALAQGAHSLMLATRGAEEGFYRLDFSKGHALYVIISTDWDFPDVDDRVLDKHKELHEAHPELKITHLIGPYTFTDPAVSQERRDELVGWAKGMRDTYGDEIGLHVHPRCTFVEAAGLTCLSTPSLTQPEGDLTGYTVPLGAYTRAEWNTMFKKADAIWADVGFGKPTAFRAGAWTLEVSTAQALADSGFLVDSSALNWQYMDEWKGYDIYTWNETQWAPIGDTSQPYRPTEDSILPGGKGPVIPLLEVPDNGIMVDYWTMSEMTGVFEANWSGGPLEVPTQVSTGLHPAPSEYYSAKEYTRLDAFFTYAEQYLASELKGPVVYINMSDAVKVW